MTSGNAVTSYPGAPARQLTMTEQDQETALWARSMSSQRFTAALATLRDSPRAYTTDQRKALITEAIRRLAPQPHPQGGNRA